mmetsp:Transcript_760/g.1652  ORF Transcript_760/g.1652 Transcript_760/m.1652 type:complete len:97 (-) Transcript_760:245-535(-)
MDGTVVLMLRGVTIDPGGANSLRFATVFGTASPICSSDAVFVSGCCLSGLILPAVKSITLMSFLRGNGASFGLDFFIGDAIVSLKSKVVSWVAEFT